MIDLVKVARPYALAAFEIAFKQKKLAAWNENLDILLLLLNPKLTNEQLFDVILSVCPIEEATVQDFLRLVLANHRLEALPWILLDFVAFRADYEKTLDAEVVSAYPLTEKESETLADKLEQRLQRKIRIQNTVKPSLLGGAIIYAGDLVLDGSALGRLKQLDKSLKGDQLCN